MQISVRAKENTPAAAVTRSVKQACVAATPGLTAASVNVEKVFPADTPGRRGRLYVLDLPDNISDVEHLLRLLRQQPLLDAADLVAPKQAV